MQSKIVFVFAILASLFVQSDAGIGLFVPVRSKYLALEMITNRCMSQTIAFAEANAPIFHVKGVVDSTKDFKRKLLGWTGLFPEEQPIIEMTDEADEEMRRQLLGMIYDARQIDKENWRQSACQAALSEVNAFCSGAPDDLGPAAMVPWLEGLACTNLQL